MALISIMICVCIAALYLLHLTAGQSTCASGLISRDLSSTPQSESLDVPYGQQRIIPGISFNCSGAIISWTIRAQWGIQPESSRPRSSRPSNSRSRSSRSRSSRSRSSRSQCSRSKSSRSGSLRSGSVGSLFPHLQIWRRCGDASTYFLAGDTELEPDGDELVCETDCIYSGNPDPALEFQAGDVLGIFQPSEGSCVGVYYDTSAGPTNYFYEIGDTDEPPLVQDQEDCLIVTADGMENGLPLLSVEITSTVAGTPPSATPTATPPQTTSVPLETCQVIKDRFGNAEEVPPSQALSDVFSNLQDVFSVGCIFPQNFSQSLLNNVSDLIDNIRQGNINDEDNPTAIGSTLLYVLDRFALEPYDPGQGILEDTDNINLVHRIIRATPGGDPSDEVKVIARNGNRIILPREVFMNCSATEVSVASYFYRNLSDLLPDSLPGTGDTQSSNTTTMRLASGILSSALQCGSTQYNAQDLINPVEIVFSHPQKLELRDGTNTSVQCVFWQFDDNFTNGSISGRWATEGCTRNTRASDESRTVCECNHLTHFALLLSTTEVQLTRAEAISLRIIGIICVAISLVCLTITILTFLFLKSLWSMRNYIHVNLCASLFVAQLTFIVAMEPRGSVVGCQVAAVLLHYFFLVTFMWMLMEGVVLYVALVRVFIKFRNRYLIAFTLASYGIPLLYLGVTVPLGFVLQDTDGPHYAGDAPQSCWLRYDTHFIWAFVAPVIAIILVNIGFFIMAITIMYRHKQKETHQTKTVTIKHWLKTSISLVVVMGITWIVGILVFNRDLLFVAYIYTIFIGLQGLIIFILFVVLSNQVREAYAKWWKAKVASSDFLSRHFGEKSSSQTAMTSVHSSPYKRKNKRDSPTLEPMGNSHKDSSLTEEKGNPLVFDVTLVQGATSFESEAATDRENVG